MKPSVVQYRNFRFSKLNTQEFSHLKLLIGWIGYFILYFLTEALIPAERCTPVRCFLDDWIPFCEWFVIPYVLWYGLVAGSVLYFALYNITAFRKLSTYLIITQIAAMAVYILLPNRQDLRPAVFPRENFLTRIVSILYSIDTNTNVCPSLHCIGGFAILFAALDMPQFRKKAWPLFFTVFALLICASTVFMKQHSIVDFFAAIPVIIIGWLCVYLPALMKRKQA